MVITGVRIDPDTGHVDLSLVPASLEDQRQRELRVLRISVTAEGAQRIGALLIDAALVAGASR
jgi:hypothetical protein